MAETRTAEMQEPRRESALGRVETLTGVSGVSGDHGCWFEAPQSLQLVNLRGDPDDRIYCDRVRDQLELVAGTATALQRDMDKCSILMRTFDPAWRPDDGEVGAAGSSSSSRHK